MIKQWKLKSQINNVWDSIIKEKYHSLRFHVTYAQTLFQTTYLHFLTTKKCNKKNNTVLLIHCFHYLIMQINTTQLVSNTWIDSSYIQISAAALALIII